MDFRRTKSALGALVVYGSLVGLVVTPAHAAPPPKLSVSDATVTEGDAGQKMLTFEVSIDRTPTRRRVTVNYATQNGTATAGTDYVTTAGTLSFARNTTELVKEVSVPVNGDLMDEPDETLNLILSGAKGAGVADSQGVGTIEDDDAPPQLSIDDSDVVEGDGEAKTMTFTVSLSSPSNGSVTFDYATSGDSATEGTDFDAASGTVVFPEGTTSRTVTVTVNGDVLDEATESFFVDISDVQNATVADGQGIGTIIDNDISPSLSVNDVTVAEGSDAIFTVTLSQESGSTVTVQYATSDGTATDPADYDGASGTLTFAPGELVKTVSIPTVADAAAAEGAESFTLTLSSPSGAAVFPGAGTGTGTIVDDDGTPVLVVSDAIAGEADDVNTKAIFTVTLSQDSATDTVIGYTTADGSATTPDDYAAVTSGQVTIPAGERTAIFEVDVAGDVLDESNETFTVTITTDDASVIDQTGTGTIIDNDPRPQVSITDVRIVEGNDGQKNAVLEVTLSGLSGSNVIVPFETVASTANINDYVASEGTVSIPSGESTATITIPIRGDKRFERNEHFFVALGTPDHASLEDGLGKVTILNDDSATTLKVVKRTDVIKARGTVRPPHPGIRMAVKLFKRKAGEWVLLKTRRPVLSAAGDRNNDGQKESIYKTRFARPSTGTCKITARFPGDGDHGASKRTKRFTC